MTVVVPEPVPLAQPDEHPDALADLVLSVAGAAESLALVGDGLAGAPGAVPHWVGADADAAAAQLGVLRGLTRECSVAVLSAAGRLSVHSDRLEATRAAVATLRAEQDEDVAATWRRLGQLPDYVVAVRTDALDAQAIVDELRATEEGRRRRHAALLEDLAADSAATARVLADAAAVVGGRGAPGDGNRVVGRLAPELRGWGDAELTARGHALAEALPWTSPHDMRSLIHDAATYAGQASFADALLLGLGVGGIRDLLALLGDTFPAAGRELARLLGVAFGAAEPTGAGYDPVGDMLDATFVDPGDGGRAPDLVVLGMGMVLAVTGAAGGPPLRTVLAWGRQMIAREHVQAGGLIGSRALDREQPQGGSRLHEDPMALVAQRLADAGNPAFAAQLLSDRTSWEVLLSRPWDDGGTVVAALVRAAGADPGPVGDGAVRAGLEALGSGLGDDGNPAHWTVDRGTAAVVAPALGSAVAAHAGVAADVMWSGVRAQLGTHGTDALRGLGYLTLDAGAAEAVHRALVDWSRRQRIPVGDGRSLPLMPAVVVPAAYVAVEEYGQRLAHALDGFERERDAEADARTWDLTVGALFNLLPGRGGVVGGVLAGYAAQHLGMDGTWDNGPDRGLHFRPADAREAGLEALPVAGLPAEAAKTLRAVAAQAGSGYDRTASVLGLPAAPTSPVSHWWTPLVDAVQPGLGNFVGKKTDRELRQLLLRTTFAGAIAGTPLGTP